MESPFRTVREAATWLHLSECRVRRLIEEGKLPARKHGGKVVVLFNDLAAFSEQSVYKVKKPSITRFQEVRERLRSLKTEYTTESHSRLQKGA